MSDSAGQITVACSCGKRLKAPATAVGRKAKCPSCGNVLTVAAPNVAPSAAPIAPRASVIPASVQNEMDEGSSGSGDDFDALYDLASRESAAGAAAEAADTGRRCPECRDPIAPDAVLCTNCGYDVRRGSKLATENEHAPMALKQSASKAFAFPNRTAERRKAVEQSGPQGTLRRGVIMSLAYAVGVGVVWFVMVAVLGGERNWMMIPLAGAAAAGMRIGFKGTSMEAGLLATLIAMSVILGFRIAMIQSIHIPAEWKDIRRIEKERADAIEQEKEDRELAMLSGEMMHIIAAEELKAQKIDADKLDPKDPEYENKSRRVMAANEHAEKILRTLGRDEKKKLVPQAERMQVRERLIGAQVLPQLKKRGLNPEFSRVEPDKWAEAERDAVKAVDAMSYEQQKVELAKADEIAKLDAQSARMSTHSRGSSWIELPSDHEDPMVQQLADRKAAISVRLFLFGIMSIIYMFIAMCVALSGAGSFIGT